MITVAIHSPNNPDILIAMRDSLVDFGIKDRKDWNADHHPYIKMNLGHLMHPKRKVFYYTLCVGERMSFYSHKAVAHEHVELIPENFEDVLNFVLLAQIWEG